MYILKAEYIFQSNTSKNEVKVISNLVKVILKNEVIVISNYVGDI